jgi:uncharacterized sulfatase
MVADDHGYEDFGFMGSAVAQTPRLDALANAGTAFTAGYNTASVCVPSLRTLLTGLYPHQWTDRIRALQAQGLQRAPWTEIQDFETLPRLLSAHGYATFQGGKYWEGTYPMGGFTHGMTAKKIYKGLLDHSGADGLRLGRETMAPVFRFIDQHRDGPFFVWFAPLLPHVPHDASRWFLVRYRTAELSLAARRYYANVTRLDHVIGRLVDHLDARGLLASTLVVFLSDNGWDAAGPQHWPFGGPKGKGSLYELGVRTPIVFHWLGRVPARLRPHVLVSTVDLMPTLLDYAGIPVPADLPGCSLRPVLEGRAASIRDAVIGHLQDDVSEAPAVEPPTAGEQGYFARTSRWYYIRHDAEDREELYDAERDPGQEHNVAGARPGVVRQFRRRIRAWEHETRLPRTRDRGCL